MALGKKLTKADWKRMIKERDKRREKKQKVRDHIKRKIRLKKGKGNHA